jgi:hypothetical protein
MPTITTADIKLLASARMNDDADGGGPMTGTAVQDGAENNVFPDVSSTDRAFGRLALRKVFPAVLNTGTDSLLGSHVILDDMPDDTNVGAWAVLGTSATEDREDLLARLQLSHWEGGGQGGLEWAGAPHLGARIKSNAGVTPLSVGSVVMSVGGPVLITSLSEVTGDTSGFLSGVLGDRIFDVTLDGPFGVTGAQPHTTNLAVPSISSPRLSTTRPVTGALSIGATYCDVDTLLVPVVPKQLGASAGSAAQIGIDATAVLPAGRAVAFRAGDGLVLRHSADVAPDTYADGDTISAGRTGLSDVRLVDNNGAGILSGWTVNLATGIVTVVSTTGWAQPVKVRHSIEEVVACSRTGYGEKSGGSVGSGSSLATAPFTLSAGLTMYCGRPNVGSLRVISRTGQDITNLTYIESPVGIPPFAAPLFVIDPAAGSATLSSSSDSEIAAAITSHSPVTLVASGSYAAPSTASAPQTTLTRLTFNRELTKAFPSGTLVSSMLLLGDLQANVGAAFSQESWTSAWADSRIGSAIAPQYQQLANPIVVNNAGAISERWAIIFLTSSTFRVVGESVGQIATGSVAGVLNPTNPATGQPYFTLSEMGWGSGWAAGNVLRFNTTGANAPVWAARAVLPSAPSSTPDSLTIAVRGDVNV